MKTFCDKLSEFDERNPILELKYSDVRNRITRTYDDTKIREVRFLFFDNIKDSCL